jgi:hypothetical protein
MELGQGGPGAAAAAAVAAGGLFTCALSVPCMQLMHEHCRHCTGTYAVAHADCFHHASLLPCPADSVGKLGASCRLPSSLQASVLGAAKFGR